MDKGFTRLIAENIKIDEEWNKMHPILKDSLKMQVICPECGYNWEQGADDLAKDINSEDCWLALFIIRNCPACSERFAVEIENLKGGR